ncbi:hypothetical protein MicloDRAFT_00028540 [Microvirga lotononidis]|uniref:Uncharacterized protein n=1 Tax=Microvirga lotononidis TaxID=864069 RepID=I4YQR3_9HYPH|nr:hypothetical protein MicloDRAFT_00028540 [Microvirga lotononidis]
MVPADQRICENARVIDDQMCDGGTVLIADLKREIIKSDLLVSP